MSLYAQVVESHQAQADGASHFYDNDSFETASSTDWISCDEVAQLRHESSRLQHLLQVMPAGVVVLDAKGIVRQVNQQALALLGEPLEGQVWRHIIARAFQPRADDGHEVSLKDGRRVKLSITPLTDEPGQLILITDLTETRQLQDKISHMQRLSSLGRMVASLAHQIRTPLSAAMLYASNLASGKLQGEARQSFSEKLQSRLRELENQVNDMLLFAKSGDHNVIETLDLVTILKNLQSSLEPVISQRQASFSMALPDASVKVLGNGTALTGALQNLVHNAVEVIEKNAEIAMQLSVDSHHAIIKVADNGPGVPSKLAEKIFEPFYTSKSQGTGLGLAVVKSVLQAHQGSVSLSPSALGGCCFELRIPLQGN